MLIPGQHYSVEQVLPHRGQLLLLDSIDDYGPDWVTAGVRIRNDSLLNEARGVPAWVGIEYMAQTAAAYGGIEQCQRGQQPSIGFLLGTRRYSATVPWFEPGWQLRVRAQILLRDSSDLAVFACEIHDNAGCLAQAEIKAYRPQDPEAVLGVGER